MLIGAALAFCAPAEAKETETLGPVEIKSLSVSADGSGGNFTVIDSRMQETATAAVIAGLIGAGINSAINKEEDDSKAERFVEAAEAVDIEALVTASIVETLEARDFPMADPSSHKLTIEIKDWGLTRISFREPQASVFLTVRVVLKKDLTVFWDTHVKESGASKELLADITPEEFSEQITALARKTGKRVAFEIIYR
jgi:hypothetical protein